MLFRDSLFHVGTLGTPCSSSKLILVAVITILHHIIDAHPAVTIIIIVALPQRTEAVDGDHPVITKVPAQRLHLTAIKSTAKHHPFLIRGALIVHHITSEIGHGIAVLIL